MKCKNCGVDLVRGFTFCLECGMPAPPEALEESGLPPRNTDSGVQEAFGTKDDGADAIPPKKREDEITELKPTLVGGSDFTQGEALKPKLQGGSDFTQGKALRPQYIGGLADEDAGEALKAKYVGGNTDDDDNSKGADVEAVMREGSSDNDGGAEKLAFCPNCGMHMQKSASRCEICGMTLGNAPSVPKTSSGIPLFNTESDSFGGFGGFESFGGISDEDAERIDSFTSPDPFGETAINAQATPDDFAQLTEQLASFSAGAPELEVTRNTVVRQQSTPRGEDFQLRDFQLSDDLSDVAIPIYDNGVRVLNDFSLEEDPNETIPDPFAFLQTSLDEPEPVNTSMPSIEPIRENAPEQAPKPAPVQEPLSETNSVIADAPFIEEAPVITETSVTKPKTPMLSDIGEPIKPTEAAVPKAEPPQRIAQTAQPKVSVPAKPSAPTASEVRSGPNEPAAPAKAPGTENKPQHAPKIPPNMKMCPVCGRQMPNGDKFCPNCGRSMYGGAPSSNANNSPAPKKKPKTLLIVLIILFVAAAAVFFFLNQNGAFASEIFISKSPLPFFNE